MAATFPSNSLVFWPGTHAGIPADWSRATDYDAKFAQGSDSAYDGTGTGGLATHDHNPVSGHTHTSPTHVHDVTGGITGDAGSIGVRPGSHKYLPVVAHAHATEDSDPTAITLQSTVLDLSTTPLGGSGNPPYVDVIFITPDDGSQDLPDDALVFSDTNDLPTDVFISDGDNGTADYDGLFVRGAAALGDGGGTGGLTGHAHDEDGVHTHTVDDHVHAAAAVGAQASMSLDSRVAAVVSSLVAAHHDLDLDSPTVAVTLNNNVDSRSSTEPSYPEYIKLLGVENESGGAVAPWAGLVCAYKGDYAADGLPENWQLCDGSGDSHDCTDLQVCMTSTFGQVGDTGGEATHTHEQGGGGGLHSHTYNGAHTHLELVVTTGGTSQSASGVNAKVSTAAHTHAWTIGSTTPGATNEDETYTTAAADVRQPYREVVWIRYNGPGVAVKILGGVTILGGTTIL